MVSRKPETMEIFWTGNDYSVQHAYWYEGHAELDAPCSCAAAKRCVQDHWVSRAPNTMEVFWLGLDGSVQDAYWYEGSRSWGRFPTRAPEQRLAEQRYQRRVAHVQHSGGLLIGTDGSVQDAYWYEGMTGWGRYQMAPAGVPIPSAGFVLSRVGRAMSTAWITPTGAVTEAHWSEGMSSFRRETVAPPAAPTWRPGSALSPDDPTPSRCSGAPPTDRFRTPTGTRAWRAGVTTSWLPASLVPTARDSLLPRLILPMVPAKKKQLMLAQGRRFGHRQRHGRALEKLRLPVVKHAGLQLQLVAQLADRNLVDQMTMKDLGLCSGVK